MEIPVFRKGTWVVYTVPSDMLTVWSKSLQLKVASVYATALEKGYNPDTSAILAECYANKELYNGIQYSKEIEFRLESFRV